MKSLILILSPTLLTHIIWAQTSILGKVTDAKAQALSGTNIYLEATYEGKRQVLMGTLQQPTKL